MRSFSPDPCRGGQMAEGAQAGPRSASAFAPGHVTGIFHPMLASSDVLARGSMGAGVVLDLGARARAEVRPAAPGHGTIVITERGREVSYPISWKAVSGLPGAGDHHVHVDLQHELPISQGLGMSAAGSTAAALAAARAMGAPDHTAFAAAHRAELELHGGLGGVAAILGGGLEVRRAPGLPPHGRIERTPLRLGLFLGTTGATLPSPPLLSDPAFLERVRRAADRSMGELGPPPLRWEQALSVFERFTDDLGLASGALGAVIRDLRSAGCHAAQAMLGNTLLVWAPDEEGEARLLGVLRRAHISPWRVHVGNRGATVIEIIS